ncbi:MAG TPA: GNAT family N-acetyltransferase [Nocardioides sp.]|nr:GNAT family N-acetyltransferase [Nocardioides sp.]
MVVIRDVDVADEPRLREWYDAWAAAQAHRPPETYESWENARVALPRPHPDYAVELFTAHDHEAVVGAAMVNLPLSDNRTLAYAEVGVPPHLRRRGFGVALLAEVERRSRAAGRERALVEVYVPPDGACDGVGFAERHGYSVANREAMKAVDLDAAAPRWPALEAEALAARADYRVVTWRDTCPDDLVESFGAALSRVMSLIPQGDLDLEDADFTVERIRAGEQRRRDIGVADLEAAAVTPDGTVVGLTGVRVNLHDPRVAHVGVTMVLPEHRGHRLGLATKLATHRALREQVPACRLVVTSNAERNTHMNAINDALGYRQLETLLEYHRTLGDEPAGTAPG